MQLTLLAIVIVACLPAFGDGEITARTSYYKERATRVVQPMIDASFETTDTSTVDAHFLVDAITSASAASGSTGTPFSEKRYEAGGRASNEFTNVFTGGVSGKYSTEPDYQSWFVGINGAFSLAEDNFVLNLSLGASFDSIDDSGINNPMAEVQEESLQSYLGSVAVTQLVSKIAAVSLTYDFTTVNGYQANLYRVVPAGGIFVPERVPDQRFRHAIFGQYKLYVRPAKATLITGYRFYFDSWNVQAHTPSFRWIQELGDSLLHFRFRYHQQRRADFHQDRYVSSSEVFLTDDEKLSSFNGYTLGTKLVLQLSDIGFKGRLGHASGIVNVDYVMQNNRFGDAIAASVGLTLPFGDDAVD